VSLPVTRCRPTLLLALFLLASVSCATSSMRPNGGAVIIKDVPFFAQEAYQCGPASLAEVMDYWYGKMGASRRVTPEEIAASIYSPSARGVLGLDLELYARKQGFETEQYSGSVDDLKKQVDRGVPAIIFVDYGFLGYEVNHFMVVTGYTKSGVVVNSGRVQSQTISGRELERIWKKNRYWTLLLKSSA
jgi:predicted double-glycine peptidase